MPSDADHRGPPVPASGAAAAASVPARFQPLYRQIRDRMLDCIEAGEWRPGQAIPNEFELARRFGVSQGTVRRAIETLVADHQVTRRQGKGTYIASHDEPGTQFRFLRLRADPGVDVAVRSRVLACRRLAAPADVRDALGLPARQPVLHVRRLLAAGALPVVLDDIWLAGTEFSSLTLDALRGHEGSLYALFEQRLGTRMLAATEQVRAINARGPVAAALGIDDGTAVLRVERTTATFSQRPVEFRRGHYRTDRHHYFSELR